MPRIGPPEEATGVATAAQTLAEIHETGVGGLRVTVIEGPDADRSFDLYRETPQRVLLGSGPACDVRLADPTVSRRHLAFEASGKRFRVTDLGSTNGTYVDGVAIVDAFVRGGEVVRCGGTALRLDAVAIAGGEPLPNAVRFFQTLGASTAMRRLYPLCDKLATARIPVLIEGETGTGKEVLAESLHEASKVEGPFVVFDCTAVSASLVEAELFGHEKGAFTGAVASRPGLFEQAHGGTLFIDEIGDLDPALQPKLLRALDRGEIRRVGGQRWLEVDARILAATRRDLDREVEAGRFRDDLFHRLAIGRIELPPLRERKGDVTFLVRHFASQLGAPPDAIPAEVLAAFESYGWPGNVRELRNAVLRRIKIGDAPLPRSKSKPEPAPARGALVIDPTLLDAPFPIARRRAAEAFERWYVERVLEENRGNVRRAALASGIAQRYFQVVKARSASGSPEDD